MVLSNDAARTLGAGLRSSAVQDVQHESRTSPADDVERGDEGEDGLPNKKQGALGRAGQKHETVCEKSPRADLEVTCAGGAMA